MTNKKVVKEIRKENAEEENFFNEKKKKSVGKIIFDIVFWTIIACLAFVWIFDFIQVKQGKDPKFCIQEKVHNYDDGSVKECVGLGYKTYTYNRTSIDIKVQFSPFFIGMEE